MGGLVSLCLFSVAAASVNAGMFPLADVRHDPTWMGAGMFVLPFAYVSLSFQKGFGIGLRVYSVVNFLCFLVCGFLTGGGSGVVQEYGGLMQRALALAVFVPIAVWSHALYSQENDELTGRTLRTFVE